MNTQQQVQFENSGFLHLPGLMRPSVVERVAGAFERASDGYEARWKAALQRGEAYDAFFDLDHVLDRDDVFIDLVDLPVLMPHLLHAVGDDIQLNETAARLFPPGKTFTAPWHSDLSHVLGVDLAHSPNFFVKVHFFFEDLDPDQGCLAFIPGTHRLPTGTPRPRLEDGEHSPAVVKIVPKAGDCVMFNCHVMHMALDNTSAKIRKSLIYTYSHFWVKQYPSAVPKDLSRVAHTPLRRQLFGVPLPGGVSHFDYRLGEALDDTPHGGMLRAAGRRLMDRLGTLTAPRSTNPVR